MRRAPLGPYNVPNFSGAGTSFNGRTGIAADQTGAIVYAVNNPSFTGPSTVEVFDAAHNILRARIALPTPSFVLRSDPAHERLYALSFSQRKIFIIDTAANKVTGYVYEMNGLPTAAALSADGSRMYVAARNTITVFAMDTPCRCGVATKNFVAPYPIAEVALNPAGTHVYASQIGPLPDGQPAPVVEMDGASGGVIHTYPAPKNVAGHYTTTLVEITVR